MLQKLLQMLQKKMRKERSSNGKFYFHTDRDEGSYAGN